MTFGTDLKEQIPSILNYVEDGIQSLSQFRNFVKDRSAIEREYAQKLESLCKKYKPNKKSPGSDTQQQTDDWDWEDKSNTTSATWCQLINQISLAAKTRFQFVDELNAQVVESLRGAVVRKEDSRKKSYAEKDKAKQLYDDACIEIENLRAKINKSSGDNEKYQRQLDAALIDCDNKKNMYLLAIHVANAEKDKYFEQDIPVLADSCHDNVLTAVQKLDPVIDAGVFTRHALGEEDVNEKAANVTFTFMPWNGGVHAAETIIDRDDNLVASDSAVIFLNNKLVKNRKLLDAMDEDLAKKSLELSQLISTKMLDLSREITLLTTQKVRTESETQLIIENIGDDGLQAQNHDFKPSSFTIPTTCDLCSSTIWGLSNKGLTCRGCGFNCHTKCEMKVAPNCSKVKGQLNPQPTPSSFTSSSTMARSRRQGSVTSDSRVSIPSTITPSTTVSPSSPTMPTSTTTNSLATPSSTFKADVRSLYDYDAQNEDELSIRQGELLELIEQDDGSGWIKAKSTNHCLGLIPTSYVEYLSSEPEERQEIVVALYDFEAASAEELNMKEGDIIYVTKKDDSGWWEGVLDGKTGIFPSNYVGPSQ
ncbi:hypothetical protein EDC96DRAFT_451084 [Choanephora cucurbitarum]|nr:hypothetical protein EDC96DRAFT_451084 [Choanephora cucurbitarum]